MLSLQCAITNTKDLRNFLFFCRLTAEATPESSSWEHVESGSLSGWPWPVPSAQCSPHPLQSGRINQQQVTG